MVDIYCYLERERLVSEVSNGSGQYIWLPHKRFLLDLQKQLLVDLLQNNYFRKRS